MSSDKISKTTFFSETLDIALNRFNLKQKDIAEKTGIPRGRISEYATGKTDPGIENVIKIASAFGLKLSEFFALRDSNNSMPGTTTPPPIQVNEEVVALRAEVARLKDELLDTHRRKDQLQDQVNELRGPQSVAPQPGSGASGAPIGRKT